jgi:PKD repeat protein
MEESNMNRKKTKILSIAAVLLMLGTLLTAVAFVSGANGDENGNLTINVQDNAHNPVNNYYVELYNVVGGDKDVYKDLSFTSTLKGIAPGYYELVFPTQKIGDTVYFRSNTTVEIYPDETAQVEFTINSAYENLTLQGYARYTNTTGAANATVTIMDTNSDFSDSVMTDSNGHYKFNIYSGDFIVKITHGNSLIYYNYTTISNDTWLNGTLDNKPYIWGSVLDENGDVVSGEVRIILHDLNTDETFLHVSKTGAYMVPAYKGNFSMFINANGYDTYYIPEVDCDGNSVHMETVSLEKATGSSLHYAFSFENGFNTLHVQETWKLSPSETINALPGSNMGNIRLQLDKNGDGVVNSTEESDFVDWLNGHASITTTYGLISVNGTYYMLNDSSITSSVEGLVGNDNSSSPVFINTSFDMTSYSNIEEMKDIPVRLIAHYDDFTDYSYTIDIPSGYERTSTEAPSEVSIDGFTTVDVNPASGTGTATVSFTMEKSLAGNASINVATGTYVYDKGNGTYIIHRGKDTTFTAVFTDPNGNEKYANYTWNFDDGTTKYGKTVEHNYSNDGKYNVQLTVKEAGGNITTANVTMLVDGQAPTPVIKAKVGNETFTDNIVVDENTPVEFNATGSSDNEGIIPYYEWRFGDNSSSTQKIVDHAYKKWGNYTVKLIVKDAVGNSASATIHVTVNDKTPPVPRFNWTDVTKNKTHSYNEGKAGEIDKGDTVRFDASPSYDPAGFNENGSIKSYSWKITKGNDTLTTSTDKIFTYTFETPGEYTVSLNVTDKSGNYKEISRLFNVGYGPHPSLLIENMTFSTDSPVEGEPLYIYVNVTNTGDKNATDINVDLYVNGNKVDTSSKFYKVGDNGTLTETSPVIPAKETRVIKIEWTPSEGSYEIKVNITASGEPTVLASTHESKADITVGPAAWKGMIPVIVLIVVILAIIGVYYAYTKGIGPFGEGGSKPEKKEKKK